MRMRITAFFVLASLMMPNASAWELDMDDARMMAKCLWGECRGEATMHQAAVAWVVLNRVDDERFPDTIREVIGQPYQFTGYSPNNPVDPDLLDLSMDVIIRWMREHDGEAEVGRVIPSEYVYFCSRNGHNAFCMEYPITEEIWDWSAEDPYSEEYMDTDILKEEQDDDILSDLRHWTSYRMDGDRDLGTVRDFRSNRYNRPRRR